MDERIKAEVLENYSLPTNLFKRMLPKEEQVHKKQEAAAQQPPRVSVKVVQATKPGGIDYEHEISDFLQRTAYRISD